MLMRTWRNGDSHTSWWVQDVLKKLFGSSSEYETELPEDPAILLLDTHPGEMETSTHIKPCTQMFTAMATVICSSQKMERV